MKKMEIGTRREKQKMGTQMLVVSAQECSVNLQDTPGWSGLQGIQSSRIVRAARRALLMSSSVRGLTGRLRRVPPENRKSHSERMKDNRQNSRRRVTLAKKKQGTNQAIWDLTNKLSAMTDSLHLWSCEPEQCRGEEQNRKNRNERKRRNESREWKRKYRLTAWWR